MEIIEFGLSAGDFASMERDRALPEHAQTKISQFFSERGLENVLIYGDAEVGRPLKQLMGRRFLGWLNAQSIDKDSRLEFDAILLAVDPALYIEAMHTIWHHYANRSAVMFVPFTEKETASPTLEAERSASDLPETFYDFTKLVIITTTRCNLACKMCHISQGKDINEANRNALTREQAMDAARFAVEQDFKMVEVTGGEPLTEKYTIDVLEELAKGNINSQLTTNASLLSEEQILRLADIPGLQVQVSFDGLRDTHNAIRGRSTAFDKTDRAVRSLAEKGVSMSFNTVCQRDNVRDLFALYKYLSDIPFKFYGFSIYEPGSPNMEQIRILPEDLPVLMDELQRIEDDALKNNKYVRIGAERKELFAKRILQQESAGRITHPGFMCTVPRRLVIIDPGGDVYPCYYYPWRRGPQRNLNHNSIKDIVLGQDYINEIRDATTFGKCKGCSTYCFMWDHDFERRQVHPVFYDKMLEAEAKHMHARLEKQTKS